MHGDTGGRVVLPGVAFHAYRERTAITGNNLADEGRVATKKPMDIHTPGINDKNR